MRVLLLQIRDHAGVEEQERRCFVDCSGLPEERWSFQNLIDDPELDDAELDGFEVVVIGGAGKHSVTEEYEFSDRLAALVRRRVERAQPLFGSCWGHQFVARALGGAVITDLPNAEVGTLDLELTEAGRGDPWLAGLPDRFPVQMGHKDRVVELPAGAIELAVTDRLGNQAFRLAGLPVCGAQFHVELDAERMLERATVYRGQYVADPEAFESFRRSLRPSPESWTLFRRFLASVAAHDRMPRP